MDPLITVESAIEIVKSHKQDFGTELVHFQDALGRISASDWYSDRPMPPYDRVTMDGIAIVYQEWLRGRRSFQIAGIAAAGAPKQSLDDAESCLEVMTGAIMPQGVDTVIRYEDCEMQSSRAYIADIEVKEGQNVHKLGRDRLEGELLVARNTEIRAAEIAVACTIGLQKIIVKKNPKVVIISTGDELVEIDMTPLAHQIRKSNVYALQAYLQRRNIQADTSHLNDNYKELRTQLNALISEYDVVILSGGVSKGKFDHIPDVLKEIGIEKKFHGVQQRPGKPFWFGTSSDCIVFALPGNPISSFVCAHKYIGTWLDSCLSLEKKRRYAKLAEDFTFKPNLHYFMEVSLEMNDKAELLAFPKKGNGSGDLANLSRTNGFVEVPKGKEFFTTGEVFLVM